MRMPLFVTKHHENYIYVERKTSMTEKPSSQYLCLQRDATGSAYKITWWRIATHHLLFLHYSLCLHALPVGSCRKQKL